MINRDGASRHSWLRRLDTAMERAERETEWQTHCNGEYSGARTCQSQP